MYQLTPKVMSTRNVTTFNAKCDNCLTRNATNVTILTQNVTLFYLLFRLGFMVTFCGVKEAVHSRILSFFQSGFFNLCSGPAVIGYAFAVPLSYFCLYNVLCCVLHIV